MGYLEWRPTRELGVKFGFPVSPMGEGGAMEQVRQNSKPLRSSRVPQGKFGFLGVEW